MKFDRMSRVLSKTALTGLCLATFSGIEPVLSIPVGTLAQNVGTLAQNTVVQATDGRSQIRLPSGWTKMTGLNDKAEIQVGSQSQSAYLIVLTETKADFDSGLTYRQHARLTLDILLENAKNARITKGPTEVKVGGRSAVQYEVNAQVDNFRVIYLHTTVDGQSAFHQIVAWTVPSQWQRNRTTMQQVINSFAERK